MDRTTIIISKNALWGLNLACQPLAKHPLNQEFTYSLTLFIYISLFYLKLSPLDELETTNPGHVITNQDLTETHRRTDSLLCRQLFPSNTNMSSEQRQSDSCTDPDISSMQPSLAGMMSYSVSPALSSTLPSGNPNDHLYGKTKSKSTSRKKKKKKVKPGVAKLAQQLASVPESPVLTLKQRASINLGVKEGILSSDIAASVLSVPTVRSAVVQRLTEEISAVTGKMKNRKRGKLSTLMRKDFDAMQNCSLVEVVEEFHIKLPELFRLILGAMVRKNLDSETLRPLIPRLAMVYSILMQSRCPTLSRIQRVMSMSLADQICNQKVSFFISPHNSVLACLMLTHTIALTFLVIKDMRIKADTFSAISAQMAETK